MLHCTHTAYNIQLLAVLLFLLVQLPVHVHTSAVFYAHFECQSQCFILRHQLLNGFNFLGTVCSAFCRQPLYSAMLSI